MSERLPSHQVPPSPVSRGLPGLTWILGRGRIFCLVVFGVVTAVLALHAAHLGIEKDNASLDAADPAERRFYADFKKSFGSDEDLLLAVTHPHLLEPEGLALLDAVTRTVAGWDGVRRVWSLTNIEELVRGDVGAQPRALLSPPWDAPGMTQHARAAVDRNPDLEGWLVSSDRRTAGVVVQIEDRPGDADYSARLIDQLRGLEASYGHGGAELHLTGVPVQKYDVSGYVARDQRVLLPLAVLVLAGALAVFFRHPSGVIVPLVVAGATVVWTLGIYDCLGHSLNAITSLLPPVLLVVAMASSVHVYDAWQSGHHGGGDGRERVARAVGAIIVPALLCAVTNVQGFLSLGMSGMPAVRQFGMFASIGVAAAFVIGMTAVPAALTYLSPPLARPSDQHGLTLRFLDVTSHLATSRPWAVLLAFTVVTVVLAAGIPLIRSNTDLVGFLREDAPLRIDTSFIDQHLAGTMPVDFVLARRDGDSVASLDAYRRLEQLEGAIAAREQVAGVTSVVALVRQVHRAESTQGVLELPGDDRELRSDLALLDESGHDLVRRFATPEFRSLRVTVRLHAIGTAKSAPLVAGILADAQRVLGPDYTLVPTGALWHVVHDSDRLVIEQTQSFGSAIVLVVLAIGLLLRSVTFTVLAMIPNVMPILWTGGIMGYGGIELSSGTAMIASATLGLVVDDTIHYLWYYRGVYAGDAVAAIRNSTRAVGAPVTVASTSLVLGFWVGAFGSFQPTIYFSLLTGLTMITGVLCDLLLLPASLVLLDRLRTRAPRLPAGPERDQPAHGR
ncbi:MAG: MMPL family transporter [Deltaproteobacteria bacterium]|nr:MMPL family transporter [Deltaproteobacteria bacterium]